MKRTFFFLTAFLLLLPAAGFPVPAQEQKAAEATDQTLASLDQQTKTTISEETRKAESETDRKEYFSEGEIEPEPSLPEEKSDEIKTASAETVRNVPSPNLSRDADSAEINMNWEALFSKEKTPDSVIYTIQPGDSLYVIAEKNRTTIGLLKKMNGLKGDTIYAGRKLKIFKGIFSVVVSKSANTLTLFADEKPIKTYRVSTGEKNSTPAGEFKIVNKLENPTWFKTGAIYPPGSPDNALGTRWLGFDLPAYGIHGTIEPEKIGKPVSQGCIRMLNGDVEELDSLIPLGTKVTVKE